MQTRADLYKYLGYHAYEDKLDQLFADGEGEMSEHASRPQCAFKPKKSVACPA